MAWGGDGRRHLVDEDGGKDVEKEDRGEQIVQREEDARHDGHIPIRAEDERPCHRLAPALERPNLWERSEYSRFRAWA